MTRPVSSIYTISCYYNEIYDDPKLPACLIGKKHPGVDYRTPVGTPVVCPRRSILNFFGEELGYGNTVLLKFWTGIWPFQKTYRMRFAHLSAFQGLRQIGQKIDEGVVIVNTGNTGWSTGPHLHFQLDVLTKQGWRATDPYWLVGAS